MLDKATDIFMIERAFDITAWKPDETAGIDLPIRPSSSPISPSSYQMQVLRVFIT